jgi:hypothetical protein
MCSGICGIRMIFILIFFICQNLNAHCRHLFTKEDEKLYPGFSSDMEKFLATSVFLDAAINSYHSLTSLLKKENYRIRIASLNNPSSTELGFSLESEIKLSLQPLLAKAKNTDPAKFSQVVSSVLNNQNRLSLVKTTISSLSPALSTLMSLAGTLALQEKKITREDLDEFLSSISRYFVQFQKLNQANQDFDRQLEQLDKRLKELRFDMLEFMADITSILYRDTPRSSAQKLSMEEMFLKYLEVTKVKEVFNDLPGYTAGLPVYPSDGIKTAKEIAYTVQKLFEEYQKLYADNYQQVRAIVMDSKSLGKNINLRQVEQSLQELEVLYRESRDADQLALRLKTVFERLNILTAREQNQYGFK